MNKVELLLPAGNENSLRAAVNNGADAVYLGMNRFNARQSAGNFNEKNISSVIDYCHKRNVKVYVTFNTLVKNDELAEYFRLMGVAYSAKADAVIIQDPCFIPTILQNFPGLKIHLSTQATTTNSASIPIASTALFWRASFQSQRLQKSQKIMKQKYLSTARSAFLTAPVPFLIHRRRKKRKQRDVRAAVQNDL